MDLLCGGTEQQNNEEEYLARVNWMHGNILTAQVLNKHHTKIKILKFDIKTGQRKNILVEENSTWITLHDCFTPLDKGVTRFSGGFIWASEKTGFRHLYLHDASGTCLGPITEGEWMVEQIAGVNEATGLVYFTGTLDGPLESNLYCAKLFVDGSQPLQALVRLTQSKGKHIVVLDHHMQSFVDIHDSLDCPPRVLLCSLDDGRILTPLEDMTHNTGVSKPATKMEYKERSRDDMLSDCQKLVKDVLREHPEGYNISCFRKLFFKRYGYSLDFQKLGYKKLASLLQIMPGVKIESSFIFPSVPAVLESDGEAPSDFELSDSASKDENINSP